MNKKVLDRKYSYRIDEHNAVHLFRGEDECQQFLTNPLLSAIFKIEELEKENKKLRIHQTNAVLEGLEMEVLKNSHRDRANNLQDQLTKAKEIIKTILGFMQTFGYSPSMDKFVTEAEQFIKDSEVEK